MQGGGLIYTCTKCFSPAWTRSPPLFPSSPRRWPVIPIPRMHIAIRTGCAPRTLPGPDSTRRPTNNHELNISAKHAHGEHRPACFIAPSRLRLRNAYSPHLLTSRERPWRSNRGSASPFFSVDEPSILLEARTLYSHVRHVSDPVCRSTGVRDAT